MLHFFQRETSCNETISENNCLALAEVITIKATRVIGLKNKSCKDLYSNLIKDIFHGTEDGHVLSDSYDLLQEVATVLYRNKSKKLSDKAVEGDISVSKLCNRVINRAVYQIVKYRDNTCPIIPKKMAMLTAEYTEETNDHKKADEIINSLNLNEVQLAVLNCLIANMRYSEILSTLHLPKSAPWNCRLAIRNKYRKVFGIFN